MITDMKQNTLSSIKETMKVVAGLLPICLFSLLFLTSCFDNGDWDAPSAETAMAAYGNQNIEATNVKTIAEVKALFSNEINNNSLRQVKEKMQIQRLRLLIRS